MRNRSDDVGGRNDGLRLLAAAGEEVGEQGLEQAEPLRRHRRARGPLLGLCLRLQGVSAATLGTLPLCRFWTRSRSSRTSLPKLRRSERHGAAVLTQDPGGEPPEVRVGRDEDAVLDPAVAAVQTVDPPGRVAADLDPRLADGLADLPGRAEPVLVRVEAFGQPEIALAARREADVTADARDPERLHLVVVEVEADDVPLAPVEEERVRVHGSLAALVANDRPVLELQSPVLRDRTLELREPPGQLGRVAGVVQLDRASRLRGHLLEARPAEREVLEREP